MARVKTPRRNHRKKIMKAARGYVAARRRRYKAASEAVWHAGQYAFAGRRLRRRDLRSLWIERLNAAVRQYDLSYSKFMSALKKSNVSLDRKILSDIAISDPEGFKEIVKQVVA